jgi:hypothetical protein
MANANGGAAAVGSQQQQKMEHGMFSCSFRMPLHYPRYKKSITRQCQSGASTACSGREYGLLVAGDVGDNWSVSWIIYDAIECCFSFAKKIKIECVVSDVFYVPVYLRR